MNTKTDPEEVALTQMEERILRLENLVAASKDSKNSLIDELLSANNVLSAASNRGKNIETVYKRMGEVHRVMSDGFPDCTALDFERQLNLVLSLSDQYQKNGLVLEKVASLHATMDQGHLKSLDECHADLAELLQEHGKLKEAMKEAGTGMDKYKEIEYAWQMAVGEINKCLAASSNALAKVEKERQS